MKKDIQNPLPTRKRKASKKSSVKLSTSSTVPTNKKETEEQELVKASTSVQPKIFISDEIMEKISYLCSIINNLEWSGILFYTVEGTIKDVANLKIYLKDILPLDRGTSVTTGFDIDERLTNYLMNDPERLDWKYGTLHSHNNMDVFFSGTDMNDLKDNAKSHNYYLSVVVNNRLDIIGKVAFVAISEVLVTTQYKAPDEDGEKYSLNSFEETYISKKEKLFNYDCEIIYSIPEKTKFSEFYENVAKILIPSKSYYKKSPVVETISPYNSWKPSHIPKESTSTNKKTSSWLQKDLSKKPIKEDSPFLDNLFLCPDFFEETVEKFIVKCFGYEAYMSLPEVLQDVETTIVDQKLYKYVVVRDFLSNFTNFYEDFFPENEVSGDEVFEIFVQTLEEFVEEFDFVNDIINSFYKVWNKTTSTDKL